MSSTKAAKKKDGTFDYMLYILYISRYANFKLYYLRSIFMLRYFVNPFWVVSYYSRVAHECKYLSTCPTYMTHSCLEEALLNIVFSYKLLQYMNLNPPFSMARFTIS